MVALDLDQRGIVEQKTAHDNLPKNSMSAILKFSKQFTDKINYIEQDYKLNPARIRFIVYWKKKDSTEDEIKIILPELNFERKN